MSKVNEILKENQLLKRELDGILELITENEIKAQGLRVIEYAFLLSESLEDIDKKPLTYLEEIFEIDKAALFINTDILPLTLLKTIPIFPNLEMTFKYFL